MGYKSPFGQIKVNSQPPTKKIKKGIFSVILDFTGFKKMIQVLLMKKFTGIGKYRLQKNGWKTYSFQKEKN